MTPRSLGLLLFVGCLSWMALPVRADDAPKREDAAKESVNLPESKRTSLGLYVTSAEAYAMWQADPDKTQLLDVRTPEEYWFVGHATMARNIPLLLVTEAWNDEAGKPTLAPNPDFLQQAEAVLEPGNTILVMCRSGQRSAPAVDKLAEAGFENVYSVTDGFEGDKIKNPDSIFNGQRKVNGWRLAGLPWTYDLDPELAYKPEQP